MANILDDFLIFFWGVFLFRALGEQLILARDNGLKERSFVRVEVFIMLIVCVAVLSH